MKIQIDLDGVLVNIYKELDNRIRDKFPELDFTCDKYITSWSMKELDEIDKRIRPFIFECFKSYDFMRNLSFYSDVLDGLNILDTIISHCDKVFVNTAVLSYDAECARKEWIFENLVKVSCINEFNIHNCEDKGEKEIYDSDVIFEDNVDNINNSNASIKFLIRRHHNRDFNVNDIVIASGGSAFIVNSFKEGVIKLGCLLDESRGELIR